ncbi:MAG TPA: hypothetical protein VK900_07370 [Anaerolineales bacterium]|nr:hypothetical protein [Anaerolineales bacterium]
MNELQQELFERQILSISKTMEYPRTPDIARVVTRRLRLPERRGFLSRQLAWSLTVLVILVASLMLIPPVRAAVVEFIQIGVVRIFRAEPTPLVPPQQEFPSTMSPVTATPGSTSQPLIPLLQRLAGEMTLEEAQQTVDYSIRLPSYPPDLGHPHHVFVQDADGDMTILVWRDAEQPDEISMSLHFLPPDSWAIKKMEPALIQETTVNGQRAFWTIGPYPIRYSNGNIDFIRMVDGRVLIWTEGEITYRLESDLSLEEAIQVAESLEPIR